MIECYLVDGRVFNQSDHLRVRRELKTNQESNSNEEHPAFNHGNHQANEIG